MDTPFEHLGSRADRRFRFMGKWKMKWLYSGYTGSM